MAEQGQRQKRQRSGGSQQPQRRSGQARRVRTGDDAGVIPVLARAAREVETAVQKGPLKPANRARFQVATLLLREERARVKTDPTLTDSERANEQKRLDGLAGILAKTAARDTTLIAMLYQSTHDAAQSCEDHVRIVDALARGDAAEAEALMAEHIGTVHSALRLQTQNDPLAHLRDALAPLQGAPRRAQTKAQVLHTSTPKKKGVRHRAPEASSLTDETSTYLGALL